MIFEIFLLEHYSLNYSLLGEGCQKFRKQQKVGFKWFTCFVTSFIFPHLRERRKAGPRWTTGQTLAVNGSTKRWRLLLTSVSPPERETSRHVDWQKPGGDVVFIITDMLKNYVSVAATRFFIRSTQFTSPSPDQTSTQTITRAFNQQLFVCRPYIHTIVHVSPQFHPCICIHIHLQRVKELLDDDRSPESHLIHQHDVSVCGCAELGSVSGSNWMKCPGTGSLRTHNQRCSLG